MIVQIRPQAVLFDMDGVISSNNDFHQEAWRLFGMKHGFQIPPDEFQAKVFGKTNEEILQILFENKLSKEELKEMSEAKEALFREIYEPHFELTLGLIEFLEQLKIANIPIALGTNAPWSNVEFTLKKGGILDYFRQIVYADLVSKPKPDPEIYLKAAELLGVKPSQEVIVFEDSLTGIKAGLDAGMRVIAVATTYPKANLLAHTNTIIDNFNGIGLI